MTVPSKGSSRGSTPTGSTPGVLHISLSSASTTNSPSARHSTRKQNQPHHPHRANSNHDINPDNSRNRRSSPSKHAKRASSMALNTSDDLDDSEADAAGLGGAGTGTGTGTSEPLSSSASLATHSKSTRSKTKANRSRASNNTTNNAALSHEDSDAAVDTSTDAIPITSHSTSDSQASADPWLSLISKSAPQSTNSHSHSNSHSNAHSHSNHNSRPSRRPAAANHSSSSDEWDMPSNVNLDSASALASASQPLSWQQELLTRPSGTTRAKKKESSDLTKSRSSNGSHHHQQQSQSQSQSQSTNGYHSAKETRSSGGNKSSRTPSSNAQPDGAAAGLTWQQQLLQSTGSSSPAPAHAQQNGTALSTPAKVRRQQQRDEETFGLGSLSIGGNYSDSDGAPRTPRRSERKHQPQHPTSAHPIATPLSSEIRYAGPTFHNSPLPSSLPTPSFILRKQQQQQQAVTTA